MCGIVGVVGDIDYKAKKAFKDMIHMDILRGAHSVGVASATRKGDFDMHKRAMLPHDFFQLSRTKDVIDNIGNVCLIGHNRYATVGAVNNVTAHPFECGDLIGAHNGTLKTRYNLNDYKDFEVDSENIYHHMNSMGVQNTFEAMSEGANNAWALAWMNKESETFHLLRNDLRPMHYTLSEDGTTFFYASEWWMLRGALDRNGIKHQNIYSTSVDELYTIKLPKAKGELLTVQRTKLEYVPYWKRAVEKEVNTPPKTNMTERKDTIKKLLAMRGTTAHFLVESFNAANSPEYYSCSLIGEDGVKGRVYMPKKELQTIPKKAEKSKLLAESVNYFAAEVKTVHFKEGTPYVVFDWRTIEEVVVDLDDLEDYEDVPFKEDLGDCVWCSDPLVRGHYSEEHSGAKFCNACVNDEQTFYTLMQMGYSL